MRCGRGRGLLLEPFSLFLCSETTQWSVSVWVFFKFIYWHSSRPYP